MRLVVPTILERGRIREGRYASDESFGFDGAFLITDYGGARLKIISCDGAGPEAQGWEHVSVGCNGRPPQWDEMCFVKALFWGDDETVVQYHPRKDDYVNHHPFVLHLWKRDGEEFELPPAEFIGPKTTPESTP